MDHALAENASLLTDWTFWSFVVAGGSLILSQFPPLHTLLRRAKIDVYVHPRMSLTHKVGNPNAQLHIAISNSGGRDVRVLGMSLCFKRDGGDEFLLPAQNFYLKSGDRDAVLFAPFKLKPGDDWGCLVNFLNFFNRAEEKEFKGLLYQLQDSIRNNTGVLGDQGFPIHADAEISQKVVEFHNKKFKWSPGEYVVELRISTTPEAACFSKKYRITLFESDSAELEAVKGEYAYGGGVIADAKSPVWVGLPLMEK